MTRLLVILSLLFAAVTFRGLDVQGDGSAESTRKPTIADSIGMNVIGGPYAQWLENGPAQFSPDGKHFAVVTHRGNLDENTNEYTLLLFRSADAFGASSPERLLTLATSSNMAAIWAVQWADDETLVFVGQRPGQPMQVYSISLQKRKLVQLTSHRTDVFAFDVSKDLNTVAYLGYASDTNVFDKHAQEYGLVVSNQHPANLLLGHDSETDDSGVVYPYEFFVQQRGHPVRQISFEREFPLPYDGLFLSPQGKYAVAEVALFNHTAEVPASWKDYKDAEVQKEPFVLRYDLIDLETGKIRPLINAPCTGLKREIAWSADGNSVIVAGTYLPLDGQSEAERSMRASTPMVAEVDVTTEHTRNIAQGNFDLVRWDQGRNLLFLQDAEPAKQEGGGVTAYQKLGDSWKRVTDSASTVDRPFKVIQDEDMNTPPKLVAVDSGTGRKNVLLDLNPQFRQLEFARVEEITWKTGDGRQVKGGLYIPPDYREGERYPLVIQTHGWKRNRFWIDGVSNAGYAAQALAGKGIIVAQVENARYDDPSSGLLTMEEGPRQAAAYEGLIDYLDQQRKMIDRNHVGIQAWSRTGLPVRYLLTFSKYPIAAAVLADSLDGGYMQYLSWLSYSLPAAKFYEDLNGGMPFGPGLASWLKHATSFNLDKVHTPVRILSFRKYSLLSDWEWYVGLLRLDKPVELITFADTKHDPVRPRERITAQQGDVDWFCFWLKGEEDLDPAKREEFARWRQLLEKQQRIKAALN
jgi:hypothetical protein